MKCPNCLHRPIEVSLHSEGMVSSETPIMECPQCSHVWTSHFGGVVKVMKQGYEPENDLAA
jgi:Zn-finger nucleic acid-binding protein